MSKKKGLTQECFDRLLDFLGPDREVAGKRYEAIRRRLMQIFTHRGCAVPEELADRTFDRVCEKVEQIGASYQGEPERYFYGVANKIYLEFFRRAPGLPPPTPEHDPDAEITDICLERCMAALAPADREMFEDYYRGDWKERVEGRKKIAKSLSISLDTLRLRIFRLREKLEQCIRSCIDDERIV